MVTAKRAVQWNFTSAICHWSLAIGIWSLPGSICDLIVREATAVPVRVHGPPMKPPRSRLRAERPHAQGLATMKTGEMPWAKSMPNPPQEPGRILNLPYLLIAKGVSLAWNAVDVDEERVR